MKRIILQLPEEVLEDLDEAADESDLSRAAFVRRAIELALAERRRNREFRAIIRSFEARPPEDLTPSKAAVRRGWPR